MDDAALDTVVWSALTGPHAHLANAAGDARRYPAEVAPFGALRPPDEGTTADLAALLDGSPVVATVTSPAARPFGVEPQRRLTVDQMVLVEPGALASVASVDASPLSVADVDEMIALARATQPGPFGRRTIELGGYIGIRVDGRLVAMGGERMKVSSGQTEISAICVDSACRGRGYAAGIVRRLCETILARGETPFLHVIAHKANAIALYERLGFARRRQFAFSVFEAAR